MDLLAQSQASAEAADAKKSDDASYVFGPVPVGNIGTVGVIEREYGERKFLYARFTGTGRPANLPLAACSTLVDALRAQAEEDAPEDIAPEAPEVEVAEEDTPDA